jgi:mRNA interferase MazF
VISRGSVCWADLGPAQGSRPAKSRPVLVVQDDAVNASRLATIIVAAMTSNTNQAAVGGNVFVPAALSGLSKDSVVNLSALFTLNKTDLDTSVGRLPSYLMDEIGLGLRLVLGL